MTPTISGPAVDAETNMQDYKGVVALQGDESTVDVGTNVSPTDTAATVVSEVTLDGNESTSVKYENAGWVRLEPEGDTCRVGLDDASHERVPYRWSARGLGKLRTSMRR